MRKDIDMSWPGGQARQDKPDKPAGESRQEKISDKPKKDRQDRKPPPF